MFSSVVEPSLQKEVPVKAQGAVCIAADLVARIMKQNGYAMYQGHVYRKLERAKFTYIFCGKVKTYLHAILANMEVANMIAPVWGSLNQLLTDPDCQLIRQIKIDYNFIEVLPRGRCFNIEKKRFEFDPVDLEGSPRAFVLYDRAENDIPCPKYFLEGVENSLPDNDERMRFYQKYYQILLCGKFPVKETKLMLLGAPDSGKTSWFSPFEGKFRSPLVANLSTAYMTLNVIILCCRRNYSVRPHRRCVERRCICSTSCKIDNSSRFHGRMVE